MAFYLCGEASMSDEPDNLILAHLREIRSQIAALDAKFDTRTAAVEQHLERMETNSLKAICSFVGHRSMVERTVADYDGDFADLKRRVRALEEARG